MFLEVLTRCYKRPAMLAVNMASLENQTDQDWEQTFLIDTVGRGIGWSYQNLAAYAPELTGAYIWILDDDDVCARVELVGELKAIAWVHDRPDVIMVRMDHGPLGVLPGPLGWLGRPAQGDIGVSAYIVRQDVWKAHSAAFGAHYAGDYDFIASVFDSEPRIYWHDVIASRVQRISKGAIE